MVDFTTVAADISFGLGLLNSFGAKVDVVGIYNGSVVGPGQPPADSSSVINSILGLPNAAISFGQMFGAARPLKATLRETSRVMQYPVESGVTLSDHAIINPVEIDIPMMVASENYSSTYVQMRQAWIDKTLLTVKTRTGIYQSMIIMDMAHDEEADMFDAIVIGLRLRQVQYVVPGTATVQTNYQPLDPVNGNTIPSGLQQTTALAGRLLTVATATASYASLIDKKLL